MDGSCIAFMESSNDRHELGWEVKAVLKYSPESIPVNRVIDGDPQNTSRVEI